MSEGQARNFRNKPEEIVVGDQDKRITIRDMKYAKYRELMQMMFELQFEAQTLPAVSKQFTAVLMRRLLSEQSEKKADAGSDDVIEDLHKSIVQHTSEIKDELQEVYMHANTDQVEKLLTLCTEGQLDPDYIQNHIESGEARNLLSWLIDRHLLARKNLQASLRSILSPEDGAAG